MAYSGGTGVDFEGWAELVKKLNTLEDKVLKKDANRDLRNASKAIALDIIGSRMLGGSGVPTEPAMLAATRPKYDRYVAIQIPGTKPKLSGLKKESAARAKSLAIAIEYGSDAPALKGPPSGALAGRNVSRITSKAAREWETQVDKILRKYGLI